MRDMLLRLGGNAARQRQVWGFGGVGFLGDRFRASFATPRVREINAE